VSGNDFYDRRRGDGQKKSVIFGKEVACLAALLTALCSGKLICPGIQMKVIREPIE